MERRPQQTQKPFRPDINVDRLSQLRKAFELFDDNGDGFIAPADLKALLKALGYQPTEERFVEMLSDCSDGETELSFVHVMCAMGTLLRDTDTKEMVLEAFGQFDREKTGAVSASEIKYMLENVGEAFNEEETAEFFRLADVNTDAEIDYGRLVDVLMH